MYKRRYYPNVALLRDAAQGTQFTPSPGLAKAARLKLDFLSDLRDHIYAANLPRIA